MGYTHFIVPVLCERQGKTMCMLDEIRAKRDEIYAIARRHKAEKLCVFGLCARTVGACVWRGHKEVWNG